MPGSTWLTSCTPGTWCRTMTFPPSGTPQKPLCARLRTSRTACSPETMMSATVATTFPNSTPVSAVRPWRQLPIAAASTRAAWGTMTSSTRGTRATCLPIWAISRMMRPCAGSHPCSINIRSAWACSACTIISGRISRSMTAERHCKKTSWRNARTFISCFAATATTWRLSPLPLMMTATERRNAPFTR